jgi:hypothetical protein
MSVNTRQAESIVELALLEAIRAGATCAEELKP